MSEQTSCATCGATSMTHDGNPWCETYNCPPGHADARERTAKLAAVLRVIANGRRGGREPISAAKAQRLARSALLNA
jgi:hypothetical protein